MPDSHNAGDFGAFLEERPPCLRSDAWADRREQDRRPHGYRRGARWGVLVCPVKVAGGGLYMGDMHAGQGDGEIAGH